MNPAYLQALEQKFQASPVGYVPPLVTFTREDAVVHGLRKVSKEDAVSVPAEYFSALEILDREPVVLLKGEPGMGKTTFLLHTALCLAGELAGSPVYNLACLTAPVERQESAGHPQAQTWSHGALFPVFIDSAAWSARPSDRRSLDRFWLDQFPGQTPEFLAEQLERGAILLLDGLDEIDSSTWGWMRSEILAFMGAHTRLRAAAASQEIFYHRLQPGLPQWKEYTLLPLTLPLMLEHIRAWEAQSPTGQDPEQTVRLFEAGGEFVRQFSAAPFTLICGLFFLQEHAGRLPSSWRELFSASAARQSEQRPAGLLPHPLLTDYSAAVRALELNFPASLSGLFRSSPLQGWNIIHMAHLLLQDEPDRLWQLIEELCPGEIHAVEDRSQALSALLAASLLRSLVPERAAAPERIASPLCDWLEAVISRGWLVPHDRYRAGFLLAWLGDRRDLEELVTIPAGPFTMGAANRPADAPPHRLTLPEFRISRYPVTNTLYRRFITAAPRPWPTMDGWKPERTNAPAVNLTWHDARAFCVWLTREWQAVGKIAANELVRLPTEAEWEKAARGSGQPGDAGRIYPWGSEWQEDCANSLELGLNDTCAAGMFPRGASPYGCLDMGGGVWEWVSSLWGPQMAAPDFPYPYDPSDGREDPNAPDPVRRGLRGGSFGSPFDRVTCTYRGGLEPIGHWRGDGFRIVVAQQTG